MVKPYEHKLGVLGEEHFDGDPIHREKTPSMQKQHDDAVTNVVGGIRAEQDRRRKAQQEAAKQQAQMAAQRGAPPPGRR